MNDDCIKSGEFTVAQVKLLEVEVQDDSVYRYDQSFYNQAECIMEMERDLSKVEELARKYFSQVKSENPLVEILSDGENKILREISL